MKRIFYLALMATAFAACKKEQTLTPADLIGKWKLTERSDVSNNPTWSPFTADYDFLFHINNDSTFFYSCSNGLCNTISGKYKIIPSGSSQVVIMARAMNTNLPVQDHYGDTIFIRKLSASRIEASRTVKGNPFNYENHRYVKQ